MGMKFTVDVVGDVEFSGLDASDIGIEADAVLAGEIGWSSSVQFEDAQVVRGEVTIEAKARLSDIEVAASDLDEFDADAKLSGVIDNYNANVTNATFEVTDSPTGFSVVEDAVGREQAIEVYSALDKAGFEVS